MGLFDFLSKRSSGLSVEDAVLALSKGAVLIDVRSKAEYEAGHAPGARPVDPKDLHDHPLDAIHGGDPLLPLVIGTGCSLCALVAAALGATRERPCPHDAVVAAHALFAAAGVVAGRDAKGPASFEIVWRDALYALLPDEVVSLVAVEEA